jgi:hypothetical protein
MPWFKIDDGFHGHPKVVDVSLDAVGLWTLAGSWCAKYLTDGFVPEKTVVRLGGSREAAGELVGAGLWVGAADGYQFKDWGDYQPLKEDVEAERAAAQERMRKVRAARKGVRANADRTDAEPSANVAGTSAEVRLAPSQSQSHPSPASSSTKKRDSAASGARLPDDWEPSAELRAWAAANTPHVNWPVETETFRDYWRAKPGAKGRKSDWAATWRNWMRRKEDDLLSRRTKPTKDEQIVDILAMGERMQAAGDRKAIGA